MDTPESAIVNWPSLLFSLLIDSLLVWAPTVLLFILAPGNWIPLVVFLFTALATNWALYARGTSLGSFLGGFRLRTRRGQPPGPAYGLILSALTLLSMFVVAVAVAVSFTPGNDASGPLGRPENHPLLGERTHRRRFLQAADRYWERWAD
ncbi:hypothetical protein [Arthrobacter sp. C9C5]|uniref:hypothetical protein n=1 Tax=Arthrobacter sp. C9C5 TaxID=2735267 RepID=UPI0015857069|nr:hypothetical protein [Arthrobacter sp. C9C5]NUU32996.1 hypothetical protein [Arthrobacter sp. C9C5]